MPTVVSNSVIDTYCRSHTETFKMSGRVLSPSCDLNNNHNYAICLKQCKIRTAPIPSVAIQDDSLSDTTVLRIGTLVRIQERYNQKQVVVKVCSFFSSDPVWEANLYLCPTSHLHAVEGGLWPFLGAISDPEDRCTLAKHPENWRFVLTLGVGAHCSASAQLFRMPGSFDCVVRYVGYVPEMGPGCYFGLEILVMSIL